MRAAAPSIWNTEMANSKKEYGLIVHTALSKIKLKADIEPTLYSMCVQGLITNEEKTNLIEVITRIVNLPELKDYFSEGFTVRNEAEIITLSGELFRPDRVLIKEKSAVVIDYKTGEVKSKHKEQILKYSDLLIEMGYAVTEKLLVYIEDEKVINVR